MVRKTDEFNRKKKTKIILECSFLWKEFEKYLSSALSCINNDRQIPQSLSSIENELIKLRKYKFRLVFF